MQYQLKAIDADYKANKLASEKGGPIGRKENEVYQASRRKRIEMADADAQYATENERRAEKEYQRASKAVMALKTPAAKKGK
jgi:hypothetical protein